jgi:hypothetical protein
MQFSSVNVFPRCVIFATFSGGLSAVIYIKQLLNVLTMNPFNAGLGALYGPLILHMPPLWMHGTAVNAFTGSANVTHPVLNSAWNVTLWLWNWAFK